MRCAVARALAIITLWTAGVTITPAVASAQEIEETSSRDAATPSSRAFMILPTLGLKFSIANQPVDPLMRSKVPISLMGGAALYSTAPHGPYAAVMAEGQHHEVYDGRTAWFWMPTVRLGWGWAPMWENEPNDFMRAFGRVNAYAVGGMRSASLSRDARIRTGAGLHIPALVTVGAYSNIELTAEWTPGDRRPVMWVFGFGWSI